MDPKVGEKLKKVLKQLLGISQSTTNQIILQIHFGQQSEFQPGVARRTNMMVVSVVKVINTSNSAVCQRRAAYCLCTFCVQKKAAVTLVALMHAVSCISLL